MNNKIKFKPLKGCIHNRLYFNIKYHNKIKVKISKNIMRRITDIIPSVITLKILNINSSVYKNRLKYE